MAGSVFGTIFKISTWGESHGPALGVVIDGCPAGFPLSEADIQPYMDRRRPGMGKLSTARSEADRIEILSGVFEGRTTGTPISIMLRNTDQRSRDYGNLADTYRPGHADFGYDAKYGIRDYRGGGRSSGRETAGRVAGGAVACLILKRLGISFSTRVTEIGGVRIRDGETAETDSVIAALLEDARSRGDSLGSAVECRISGVPAGLGDPVFEKLDANLAKAVFSIGAVKAVEIGDGKEAAAARGSANNDPFRVRDGRIRTESNHAGGILGGISTGEEIVLRAAFKPTPSISLPQRTANRFLEETELVIKGRHDPVIGPRAAVVVETMCGLVILDALLLQRSARFDLLCQEQHR
ncbi:MAG: chorismate synthase [Lachnospiraceae bacterium]|nr:chorismate synthase [Lachnospiraceae bacterium]